MEEKIKNLAQLFQYAGGTMNLAMALKLQQVTVIGWKVKGIPQKHWADILKKFPITIDTIFHINQAIKNK